MWQDRDAACPPRPMGVARRRGGGATAARDWPRRAGPAPQPRAVPASCQCGARRGARCCHARTTLLARARWPTSRPISRRWLSFEAPIASA